MNLFSLGMIICFIFLLMSCLDDKIERLKFILVENWLVFGGLYVFLGYVRG